MKSKRERELETKMGKPTFFSSPEVAGRESGREREEKRNQKNEKRNQRKRERARNDRKTYLLLQFSGGCRPRVGEREEKIVGGREKRVGKRYSY